MIVYVFSVFYLQGNTNTLISPCLIDSAASNHMTSNVSALHDVYNFTGHQHIQEANGDILPISLVGILGSHFKNVFCATKVICKLTFCWLAGREYL